MGVWKGADEPEWGKLPVEPLVRAYRIVKELDPDHPVWIVQAPRGTVETSGAFSAAFAVTPGTYRARVAAGKGWAVAISPQLQVVST